MSEDESMGSDTGPCKDCGENIWFEEDGYTCQCDGHFCQCCFFAATLSNEFDDAYCASCFDLTLLPTLEEKAVAEQLEDMFDLDIPESSLPLPSLLEEHVSESKKKFVRDSFQFSRFLSDYSEYFKRTLPLSPNINEAFTKTDEAFSKELKRFQISPKEHLDDPLEAFQEFLRKQGASGKDIENEQTFLLKDFNFRIYEVINRRGDTKEFRGWLIQGDIYKNKVNKFFYQAFPKGLSHETIKCSKEEKGYFVPKVVAPKTITITDVKAMLRSSVEKYRASLKQ